MTLILDLVQRAYIIRVSKSSIIEYKEIDYRAYDLKDRQIKALKYLEENSISIQYNLEDWQIDRLLVRLIGKLLLSLFLF